MEPDIWERAADSIAWLIAGPSASLIFEIWEWENAIASVAQWIFPDL